MALLRSFVGISLELSVAAQLSAALATIKEADQQNAIRWVPARNWHVTLAFLGDQEKERLAILPERLAASLVDMTEFNVDLSRIDRFPDASSRVVAAWVAATPELEQLYQRVHQAVYSLDMIPDDTQAFLPHITLGRIRKDRKATIPAQTLSHELSVKQINVFRSQRTHQGSIYTTLASVSLDRSFC